MMLRSMDNEELPQFYKDLLKYDDLRYKHGMKRFKNFLFWLFVSLIIYGLFVLSLNYIWPA